MYPYVFRLQDEYMSIQTEHKTTIEEYKLVQEKYKTAIDQSRKDLAVRMAEIDQLKAQVNMQIILLYSISSNNSLGNY